MMSNQGSSLIDFLPSKLAADRLLSQYWFAVYPIARIVHRPSFERRYENFWNEVQMGIEPLGSLQAIVFAAMFSGVVSMPEEIITRDFGTSKKALMENFQRGTETALARANFLRTTKIETLQALVMYMVCDVSYNLWLLSLSSQKQPITLLPKWCKMEQEVPVVLF